MSYDGLLECDWCAPYGAGATRAIEAFDQTPTLDFFVGGSGLRDYGDFVSVDLCVHVRSYTVYTRVLIEWQYRCKILLVLINTCSAWVYSVVRKATKSCWKEALSEASDIQKREARLQRRRQRERQHRAEETAEQREIRLSRRRELDRALSQQQGAEASDRARSQLREQTELVASNREQKL